MLDAAQNVPVPWHRGRLLGFDLETTAPDPREARIVTAAVVRCGGGETTIASTWLADPGVEIPEGATAVHGVTTERAREEGRPAVEVVERVIATLAELPLPVVIFNARYDATVLHYEALRYGLVPLTERREVHFICPLVIDKQLDHYRRGSRKLDAICEARGAKLDEAHEASADALAAARLAWVIIERGQVVRRVRNAEEGRERAALVREWAAARTSPAALHAATRRWAHEQAESLEAHFASKGEPQQVAREWPIITPEAVGS